MRKSVLLIPLLSLWAVTALTAPQPLPASATAHAPVPAGSSAAEESVKRFLKTLSKHEDDQARYLLSFQDLNGDGTPEAIVYLISRNWCGSGGCTTFILTPKGDSWDVQSRITITRPPIYVLSDVSNGWHSLAFWIQGGGIQPGYEAEIGFDGKTYAMNPSVSPARRLDGTPAGQLIMNSMKDAKPLYDDPQPKPAAEPAAPGSLVGFLRRLNDEVLKQGGIPDKANPVRYISAYQDLDGDGSPEAIVYMLGRNWCGSGGCTAFILTQKDGSWTKVTEISMLGTPIRMLADVSDGWHSIGVSVRDMRNDPTGDGYVAALHFDGKTYPRNAAYAPRLKGKPAGKVLIASADDAKPLYDDAAPH